MNLNDTIDLMISEDYKERFKAEYWQTKIRWGKLAKMLVAYELGELDFTPACSLDLLKDQANAMERYMRILEARAVVEDVSLAPPAEREEQTKYDSLLHLYATLDKECTWRHVTDGLPTPNQPCIVTVRSGAGAIVREGEYVEEAKSWIVGGELISGGSGDTSPAVTDWRPMPKPAGAWE